MESISTFMREQKMSKGAHRPSLKNQEELRKRQKDKIDEIQKKRLNNCRSCFKYLNRAPKICLIELSIIVFSFFLINFCLIYFQDDMESKNFLELFNVLFWTSEFYISLAILIVLLFIWIARVIESSQTSRRIKHDKTILRRIPTESTPIIQEIYMGVYCKKCIHYWISLAVGLLSVISFIYVLIIGGCERLICGSETQFVRMAIFKQSTYSNLTESFSDFSKFKGKIWSDWSMKVAITSLIIAVIDLIQYPIFNTMNNRKIFSFESAYGKDKLINDCLLCYRLNKMNKKYKIITFTFVCLIGCIIYIFFRRAICVVFDKSFGL